MSAPEVTETAIAWDNYLDHACDRLPELPEGQHWYEPVLLGMSGKGATLRGKLKALRDALDAEPTEGTPKALLTLASERAQLEAMIDRTAGHIGAEVMVYRLHLPDQGTGAALPSGCDVLDIGLPAALSATALGAGQADPVAGSAAPRGATPVVAVIDDGIGFLNERFRIRAAGVNTARTRFDAIWVQAAETGLGEGTLDGVALGRVLEAPEIDAHLADLAQLDEARVYQRLNAELLDPRARRATEAAQSHGTQVLDLAAGLPEQEASADAPTLMAVQLPPRSIEDTSGARFEAHVLVGLRWLLARAAARFPGQPVIVNLSVGMLAGPKDGSHILESQIERELTRFEAQTNTRARVVMAFGNGHRNRQVARATLAPGASLTLGWRVQPDDRTASHLEIHGSGLETLDMALTPPRGAGLSFPAAAAAATASGDLSGGQVIKTAQAGLYRLAARRGGSARPAPAHLAASIAATAPLQADPLQADPPAPAGLWQITLTNTGSAAADLRLEIQRDDRVAGLATGGRQSYFDGPGLEAADPKLRDWNALPEGCAITEGGTHSALAGCLAPQVYTVGGAVGGCMDAGGQGTPPQPAPYTAAGHADGPVTGPLLSALSDLGIIQRGVMAAGTLSGATRMLNGTSAAAPQVVRCLAQTAAIKTPPSGDAEADRAAEMQQMAVSARRIPWLVPTEMRPRLGEMVLAGETGRKPRREPDNTTFHYA